VLVNKRGLAKRALTLGLADKPVEWVSRFGSITFKP
jgi:hypothetical protein